MPRRSCAKAASETDKKNKARSSLNAWEIRVLFIFILNSFDKFVHMCYNKKKCKTILYK